jgi:hypothetical protein
MEMKQTIADLERYRDFIVSFIGEPMEMSHDKLPLQYAHWKRMARQLLAEVEDDRRIRLGMV